MTENADIQGMVAAGYGKLKAATYLLFKVADPVAARAWLAGLAGAVTNASAPVTTTGLNLAFTHAGLARLGLASQCLAGFPAEFAEGMVTTHRSRMLGDTGASAPSGWRWGGDPAEPVDVLLLLFALDPPTLVALQQRAAADPAAAGLRLVAQLETSDLGIHEHFGFHDGISQPSIEGLKEPPPVPPPPWRDSIKPGEFVLGYPDEYGVITPPIATPGGLDFGRNGTYLVFRQLQQDVAAFWTFADERKAEGGHGHAEELAAKLVGRWPSGAPLVRSPEHDDSTLASENNFAYGIEDPHGFGCPVGCHIRRTNPRDSLDPSPGSDKAVALVKRHRILRRGREYGPPLGPDPAGPRPPIRDDGQDRGLQFLCLNADLVRQFEFVQATWVASPKFAGLYDEADPVIASRGPLDSSFTIPDQPFRHRLRELPQFVTVVGGGYFFLPGIQALLHLGSPGSA